MHQHLAFSFCLSKQQQQKILHLSIDSVLFHHCILPIRIHIYVNDESTTSVCAVDAVDEREKVKQMHSDFAFAQNEKKNRREEEKAAYWLAYTHTHMHTHISAIVDECVCVRIRTNEKESLKQQERKRTR